MQQRGEGGGEEVGCAAASTEGVASATGRLIPGTGTSASPPRVPLRRRNGPGGGAWCSRRLAGCPPVYLLHTTHRVDDRQESHPSRPELLLLRVCTTPLHRDGSSPRVAGVPPSGAGLLGGAAPRQSRLAAACSAR